MSSALSRAKAVSSVGCPMRMPYGRAEQRRSRNVAAAGMFGVMSLTVLCALTLVAEKTLMLPPVQAVRTTLVHAQFRTVQAPKVRQPEMKKVLAEASDFQVAEKLREEVRPKPAVERTPDPLPKVKPKPKRKPVPAEKPRAVPEPAPASKKAEPAVPASAQNIPDAAQQGAVSSVQAAAASPGAAGSVAAEADRRNEALAAILRAVEKYKQYPRQGRRSGAEGTCVLRVHVGGDGRVDSCSLSEGSGRSVLDAAARRLGEKLVGLSVGTKGGFHVLVPVHYRLTDG